jgi:hypothetical protein
MTATPRTLLTIALVLIAVGCLQRDLAPLVPCTSSTVLQEIQVTNVDKIDFLFVVDNSGSMQEEQAQLESQIPKLIELLASGDQNDDGTQDFPPVKDLRIGVITTDMGMGEYAKMDFGCSQFGEDGILRKSVGYKDFNTGKNEISIARCAGADGYGVDASFVSYIPENMSETPVEFADKVTCIAVTGGGGCGFEHQLEAPLKALTPAATVLEPPFRGMTSGNGDENNFLRPDSLLVVLLITDEEDCSAADDKLLQFTGGDNPNAQYAVDPNALGLSAGERARLTDTKNAICYAGDNPTTALHSVQRYVDGLVALRAQNPNLLVFSAITGIPTDVGTQPENFQAILDDDRMQYGFELVGGSASACEENQKTIALLKRACGETTCENPSARGIAAPGRRIVETLKGLDAAGAAVTLYSICQEDYRPALDDVVSKIADVLRGTCLPRPLSVTPDSSGNGAVSCKVVETLPAGEACASLEAKGRTFLRMSKDDEGVEHEVCEITQLPPTNTADAAPTGMGWYYEFDEGEGNSGNGGEPTDLEKTCGQGGQRIRFPDASRPGTGVTIQLECFQSIAAAGDTAIDVGVICDAPGATCGKGSAYEGTACSDTVDLICDGPTGTWQIPCENDTTCAKVSGAFVCDKTTRDGTAGNAPVCVNPTCS